MPCATRARPLSSRRLSLASLPPTSVLFCRNAWNTRAGRRGSAQIPPAARLAKALKSSVTRARLETNPWAPPTAAPLPQNLGPLPGAGRVAGQEKDVGPKAGGKRQRLSGVLGLAHHGVAL